MRILHAVEFAERAHRGQVRKYTGEPYIVHPLEVAQLVWSVFPAEDATIAALLHDTVEDCGITFDQITRAFGVNAARLVHEVTDISRKEHGNRATRKGLDRQHLASASPEGMTIKLADLISNTQSITQHDPDFAKVYMREKAELLPLLVGGDTTLWLRASGLVESWNRTQPPYVSNAQEK